MTRKIGKHQGFVLNALSASIFLLNGSAYALQAMDDQDLRRVDGQDGVDIVTSYSQADIDQVYWQDQAGTSAGTAKALRAYANGVKIRDTSATYDLGTELKFNTGTNAGLAGVDLQIISNPSTISIDSFNICDTAATQVCGSSIGRLALQTGSPLTIALRTTDGLFSDSSQAYLNLGINNANIYLGQNHPTNANLNNQLILKNFNFSFTGKGSVFVDDSGGLKLQTNVGNMATVKASNTQTPNTTYGYVDFTRVRDADNLLSSNSTFVDSSGYATNAGLNLEFMLKKDNDMTVASPYTLTNAKGLIRVGANGRIVNGFLQVRGTDATGVAAPSGSTLNNVLGFATSGSTTGSGANATVLGSTGIAFRMRGEFTKVGDSMLTATSGNPAGDATTLEIGGAGLNTFGFEFGNLTPLISGSTERAYFDSGSIFVNLADTKNLLMPENYTMQNSRFGGTAGNFLTSSADYNQQIHTNAGSVNPYSLILAIRGMDFQALSKRGRFTSSAGVSAANAIAPTDGLNNKWGLGLPIYNMNANLATYGTTFTGSTLVLNNSTGVISTVNVTNSQRLGFSLALSTEGVDKSASDPTVKLGTKTTSIMLIDGGDNPNNPGQPIDYYMGLRNIDMLLKGTGSIGVENGNLNVRLPNLLIVMAAEVAAGYLPGAKAKTMGSTYVAPTDNFAKNTDVLFGVKLRLQGDMNLALVPNNAVSDGTKFAVIGDLEILPTVTGNTVQISDPIDGSILGLDNLVGKIRFNNSIGLAKDNVSFNASFNFNPDSTIAGVFRAKDVNLYPPGGAGQRLGEIAITGGTLSSSLKITPRN